MSKYLLEIIEWILGIMVAVVISYLFAYVILCITVYLAVLGGFNG